MDAASGTVKAVAAPGNERVPRGFNFAGSTTSEGYSNSGTNANMATNGVEVIVGNTGGNESVNNMQPWEAVNYIIAMQGVFPSRS